MATAKFRRDTSGPTIIQATVEQIKPTPANVAQHPEPPTVPWSLRSYPNADPALADASEAEAADGNQQTDRSSHRRRNRHRR